MRVPQRMPQVSELLRVFEWARLRKVVRRSGGRRTVRRGAPDSVKAFGWKVYLVEGGCCTGSGDGEAVGGLGGADTLGLVGTGGGNPSPLYTPPSSDCFAGRAGGGPGMVALGLGCKGGASHDMATSFAGTDGYWNCAGALVRSR